MSRKPRVIVFDLDYTLWPFYVDCSVTPPFRKDRNGDIVDQHYKSVESFKDVTSILDELYSSGYQLAVASRTGEIDGAMQLIKLFNWDKYFAVIEIFPGCKIQHFTNIQRKTGVSFSDMLFFDDEQRNITDLRSKGVTCVLVTNGVTKKLIDEGLRKFYG